MKMSYFPGGSPVPLVVFGFSPCGGGGGGPSMFGLSLWMLKNVFGLE